MNRTERFKSKQRRAEAEKKARATRDHARNGKPQSHRIRPVLTLDLGQEFRAAAARLFDGARPAKGSKAHGRALMARAGKYGRMAALAPAAQKAKWRRRAEAIFARLKKTGAPRAAQGAGVPPQEAPAPAATAGPGQPR